MKLKPIASGAIVDIVAPASKCSVQELRGAVRALRALGFTPRVPKDLFGKSFLFSNDDAVRLKHFKKAIYAPDSNFIWCVRGGYGAIRLMPEVRRWPKPRHPKILLGYSDITTLHVHLNQVWRWPTLHGPLLDRLGRGHLTRKEQRELFGILHGERTQVEFKNLQPLNAAARRKRIVRGPVVGGNMIVLQSGLGTPSAFKPGKYILFFEDTGERPHRVDRMLSQFEQAGWFKNCRAVVLGDFLLKDEGDRRKLFSDVFARFARSAKFPVLKGMPVGHNPKVQRTLPLNTPAELHLGSKARLIVQSGIQK